MIKDETRDEELEAAEMPRERRDAYRRIGERTRELMGSGMEASMAIRVTVDETIEKKGFFIPGMTKEEFEKLSGEERLILFEEDHLWRLPPAERKVERERLHRGTEEFVKEMRLKRLARK